MSAGPITTDKLISYVDLKNRPVVFDVPTSCLLCRRCLCDRNGDCPYGPFCKHLSGETQTQKARHF